MTTLFSRTRAVTPPPPIGQYLDPALERQTFLTQGQAYLADLQLWLREQSSHCAGRRLTRAYSRAHDTLIAAAWQFAAAAWQQSHGQPPPPACVLAVGGYGLGNQCLGSDVDVLVLMDDRHSDAGPFVKSLMLVLIDFRLNLGYVTRTVGDCLAKIGSDLESVTSMTSARYVVGSRTLHRQFHEAFVKALTGRGRRWMLRGLHGQWSQRRDKYQSTVYLLQPNLKEGRGGLRDLDTIRWILYTLTGSNDLRKLAELAEFEPEAVRELRTAHSTLLAVRNELHVAAGSHGDQLVFELTPEVARRFGYEPDALHSAEERFMADYYGVARTIDRLTTRAFSKLMRREKGILGELAGSLTRRRLDRHLLVQEDAIFVDPRFPDYFEEDATRVLDLFRRAAEWGYRLSGRTLDHLTRLAGQLAVTFRLDPKNHEHFMRILGQKSHVAITLTDMHECRVLGRYMPEFERLRCMVRIDHYHAYTVDEHTIKAIEMGERLLALPLDKRTHAARVARQIQRWDLLNLALVLHDIGKGFGRGHALRGGQIAQRVCERMNLPAADTDLVRFLVLSHLKLNHAAQRRDVSDPKVGRQLATEIGSLTRLQMLYVLTVCDLMAVSPDAWNDWKGQLLEECYRRTAEMLGDAAASEATSPQERAAVRAAVLQAAMREAQVRPADAAARKAMAAELDAFLPDVSDYYLLTISPIVIARHFLMRRELDEENLVAWRLHNDPPELVTQPGVGERASSAPATRYSQLTVFASDIPGTFSSICGALATKGINIWAAQIFSTRDGYAINQFQVTDLDNKPLSESLRLERLRKDLNKVVRGEMPIDDLIERHRTRQPRRARPRAIRPAQVIFDNQSSLRYSILEIRAPDRPGLLYRITRALNDGHLDIHRAIITTEAYGIVDVFFVTDMEYNKIHYEGDQHRIRKALLDAIAQD